MNDRNKHKVIGQVNHQTGDPKANASVFLFFPTANFLKTNAEHSRAPMKSILNKRVILASHTDGTFGFARHTSQPFAKPKDPFFANTQTEQIINSINL